MTKDRINPAIVPVLKPTVQRNDLGGSIFLRTSARTTEIDRGTIYQHVVDALDGGRTVGDIVVSLEQEKGYGEKAVIGALRELDELRLLEDRRLAEEGRTAERYARNINFFGSFCALGESKHAVQAKVSACKVTLLGLGGLGSHILYGLAAIGVKDVLAVEFDTVEPSNLNRQILYAPADVGKSKAEIAKRSILRFSPEMDFRVINKKIEGVDDVAAAVRGRDILICVADRPKMEILNWVNAACVEAKVPLVTGGLDTQVARYYSTLPGQGCIECWRNSVRKTDARSDKLLNEQRRTQLRGDNAAFVPFVSIIAGLMLGEFTKIASGVGGGPSALNRSREIDFPTMTVSTVEEWRRDPACPCCGTQAS